MSSELKVAANRANAMKSTGPRTSRGKTHSRLNALRFGLYASTQLLPGEDAEAHAKLRAEQYGACKPEGPLEILLTEQLVALMWHIGRLMKAQYAALRRTEISLALNAAVRSEKDFYPTEGKINAALRQALADEARQDRRKTCAPSQPGQVAPALENPKPGATPPIGITFMASYGSGWDNKHSAEISQRIRASMKELVQLHAALETIQERRRTISAATIEVAKSD